MGLFGKEPEKSPREQVREWRTKLRRETRTLDKQIRSIQGEEAKVKKSLKDAAKKGQKDVCNILAKEMVRSRKAVNKIYASKAQINSVMMQMQNQLATQRMAGAMAKSTEVMQSMNQLMRVPEIAAVMRELSKEMTKAGIIEEMMDDAFESALGDEDEEEAAEAEVDKILFEVTNGILGQAGPVEDNPLPAPAAAAAAATAASDEEEDDEMRARLEALRS
ncbi:charged multivesicular body protein 3-like [Sycon ciliatum]|uniref:charged multivesicular body protein 3-like n=1 Tax=Sycon ciliatum TaxID=27933 RepID=UPI0020A8F739|eukprot:scpid53734/ scgid17650/ Charged multivesicular body protein 3; Chromatin-modifying protein 3; Vacuolar protein sorting-associated protein 24